MPRPTHQPIGDPDCALCGEASADHAPPVLRVQIPRPSAAVRPRDRSRERPRPARPDTRATRPERRLGGPRYKKRAPRPRTDLSTLPVVAIDGEGKGRWPHLYTYLAAADEFGEVKGEIENPRGLTTAQCLDFLLELADQGVKRVFGFSIGYDLTKWLAQIPTTKLYSLCRPETRQRWVKGKTVHDPIRWRTYRLDYLRGKLTVRRTRWEPAKNPKKGEKRGEYVDYGPRMVCWDIWRFYQSKFTAALLDWKVATADKLERMTRMKDLRSTFDKLSEKEIQDYCKEECVYLAELVRRLIDAHKAADIPLTQFYGAGSTAKALLKKYEVKEYLVAPPPEMKHALWCGFFGGRFETSRVGPVEELVYNNDLSSAYPYQLTRLPCLKCGSWKLVKGDAKVRKALETARLALVHVRVLAGHKNTAWGPFPFRTDAAEIIFPQACGGTWVWKEEFQVGDAYCKGFVQAREAWIYTAGCDHKPFAFIPDIYKERLRIGKEGPGIVLKLGMNSGYGVTAQTIGEATFQSYVWAGNITSGTRAQLLTAIMAAKDPWSILMTATDGIFSTEKLELPAPEDTGTDEVRFEDGGLLKDCECKPKNPRCPKCPPVHKPLGGWEEKKYERGIFLLRPGIYFPLQPTEKDIKDVKARGMSKSVLFQNAARIEKHFEEHGIDEPFIVHGHTPTERCGCLFTSEGEQVHTCACVTCGKPPVEMSSEIPRPHVEHGSGLQRFVGMVTGIQKHSKKKPPKRDDAFGEWVDYPIKSTFSPIPKRARLLPGNRLEMFERMTGESMPYKKAKQSDETKRLREAAAILADQADGDFAEHADVLGE